MSKEVDKEFIEYLDSLRESTKKLSLEELKILNSKVETGVCGVLTETMSENFKKHWNLVHEKRSFGFSKIIERLNQEEQISRFFTLSNQNPIKFMELSKVAEAYLGKRSRSAAFIIQEIIRKLANKYYNDNFGLIGKFMDRDLIAGWHTFALLKTGLGIEEGPEVPEVYKKFAHQKLNDELTFASLMNLSITDGDFNWTECRNFIGALIETAPQYPESVKEICTKCLCWPKGPKEFEPFIETGIKSLPIQLDISKFHFGFQKEGGPLLFFPKPEFKMNVLKEIWDQKDIWMPLLCTEENRKFGFESLERPFGSAHITVMTSNEVLKHGKCVIEQDLIDKCNKKHESWPESYPPMFEVIGVSHTFDERYMPYETVVVLEVKCPVVEAFKETMEYFCGEKLNPGLHITFAARLRK